MHVQAAKALFDVVMQKVDWVKPLCFTAEWVGVEEGWVKKLNIYYQTVTKHSLFSSHSERVST